ncbi:hypothetical protein KIN20_035680 [Parelaphostrongylus tenuis]|uniref:Uncharacterized protein n=1 Tax=Parelaphostrongylus tenuis TaxID=148309 RepID=A0AAD5RBT2_PARTN|nr:hypothetical protein KIN20_035680 [Parelaphostrongylus tenuis]
MSEQKKTTYMRKQRIFGSYRTIFDNQVHVQFNKYKFSAMYNGQQQFNFIHKLPPISNLLLLNRMCTFYNQQLVLPTTSLDQ